MNRFLIAFFCGVFASTAIAAKPLSVEELEKKASHVITGNVKHVYISTEQFMAPKDPELGFDEEKRYIVEVSVTSVSRGTGIQAKQTLFARLMTSRYGADSTERETVHTGHTTIPRQGQNGQFYLTKGADQFFFGILAPNGYKRIPRPSVDYSGVTEPDPPIASAPPALE